MFNEADFMDRSERAARAGFSGVECLFPYAHDMADPTSWLRTIWNRCCSMRRSAIGRPVIAESRRCRAERPNFATASKPLGWLAGCNALGCTSWPAMSLSPPSAGQCARPFSKIWTTRRARFARYGITALIEPINTRDMPSYFLTRQGKAHAIVSELGLTNVAVPMDFYYAQVMDGDYWTTFRAGQDRVGPV